MLDVFGDEFDAEAALRLLSRIADGAETLPISIVSSSDLGGARGAFDLGSRQILLSASLFEPAGGRADVAVSVLVEELGHLLDALFNRADARGDEGAMFAAIVSGVSLSPSALAALRAEDDHAIVRIDGHSTAVELAAYGRFNVDGNVSEWLATDRLDTAGGGVAGYQLFGGYDATTFVFGVTSPVAIGTNTTFWLNTDRSLATGYQVWGFAAGAEYNVNFDAAGVPRLYTGADGQTLVTTAIVDAAFSDDRRTVEFAISGANLGSTTALDVYVDVNNSVFLPSSYANFTYTVSAPSGPLPPLVVGSATLDGSLAEWIPSEAIDTTLSTAGYDIYGRVTADTYVIAIASAVTIGANSTIWLNTDLNPNTGFQTFGIPGSAGAEYEVAIDSLGDARLFSYTGPQTALVRTEVADLVERYSSDRRIVELAIQKASIGITGTPTVINTYYDINDSVYLSSDYSLAGYSIGPTTAPVVGTVTLDGNLADWTAAQRIDGVAPVANYEVYGRTSGDSFVFAVKAPAGVTVSTFTTAWLNTDGNPATGFDIFPVGAVEGGAEFNINFNTDGKPYLYTGDAGQTLVSTVPLQFGRSADGTTVEFAITKAAIGNPVAIGSLFDVNNVTSLPGNFSGPQYTVTDTVGLPVRTDVAKKVGIVYSATTAARLFGDPALPNQLNINETAYSQLFMAAQNQAAMAGVPYDLLTEADLKDLSKLVNYDAIIFPSFQFVNSADVTAIQNTLTTLAQNYSTSLIAGGNFMTGDQNGVLLAGDPYARMKALFDLTPTASGFAGSTSVLVESIGTGFGGVGGYTAGEDIRTYANAAGVGWLSFGDSGGAGVVTAIDRQVVTGTGAGTYDAVVTSTANGDRNVHFSTEALLADNNQLWQSIQYAVNGPAGPSVGLQMSRNTSIVASRNDMDQSQFADQVNPVNNAPGIYDQLLPILDGWKAAYNFVGSYYINVGDAPNNGQGEETVWSVSLPYYERLLAAGNEIGSHSLTHLIDLNPIENTNILTTGTGPGSFDYEFRQSRDVIQANIGAAVAGYQITGVAVPGAPEYLSTAQNIIPYYNYMSGGYASIGAGYPGAFGYLTPAYDDSGKVYLAPNVTFDFTEIEFPNPNNTPEQALAAWRAQMATLTSHSDVPVIVWPWHDYGPTNWGNGGYNQAMFTGFIADAYNAGAEFVTLDDLANRIRAFEQAAVTSTIAGNVITATVTSANAGRFALDVDNLGTQQIASVAGWYAYDNDSVFTDRNGGTFAITLGATQADVTHITALPMRAELISVTGDGTGLSFTAVGEGRVTIDLKSNTTVTQANISGAIFVSQVGEILTIDLGGLSATGAPIERSVTITPGTANPPPVITSNGGNDTAAIAYAENGAVAVTTVIATDTNVPLTYSIAGGADAARFAINASTGALTFLASPDFEAPTDTGANNIYDVIVQAADSGSPVATDTQAIAVTVTNVAGLNQTGTAAADTLTGNSENDTLNGAGGNDTISGAAGNDSLLGGGGNDSISGGAGNDTVTGGAGSDLLSGGIGLDAFNFTAASQSGIGATLRDTIADFLPGTDILNLSGIDANTGLTGNQAFTLLAGENTPFTAAGQLHVQHTTLNGAAVTILQGNVNAGLAADFEIVLTGNLTLAVGDIVL